MVGKIGLRNCTSCGILYPFALANLAATVLNLATPTIVDTIQCKNFQIFNRPEKKITLNSCRRSEILDSKEKKFTLRSIDCNMNIILVLSSSSFQLVIYTVNRDTLHRSMLKQIRHSLRLLRFYSKDVEVETPKIMKPKTPLQQLQEMNVKIPKANKMPSRPKIPESDIIEKFIKGGTGKGGQKINKTNSKVQLTHIPTGIVVTSQATRSREQNRDKAREILAMKIEEMEKGVMCRKQIVIARKQMLKKRAKKKTKSKYKKLEEEKNKSIDEVVIVVD